MDFVASSVVVLQTVFHHGSEGIGRRSWGVACGRDSVLDSQSKEVHVDPGGFGACFPILTI